MYIVVLQRKSDGMVRLYPVEDKWSELTEFMWSEGNYACDCNRKLFFARTAGEPDPPEKDLPCTPCTGDEEYIVLWVIENDVVVYSEVKECEVNREVHTDGGI